MPACHEEEALPAGPGGAGLEAGNPAVPAGVARPSPPLTQSPILKW